MPETRHRNGETGADIRAPSANAAIAFLISYQIAVTGFLLWVNARHPSWTAHWARPASIALFELIRDALRFAAAVWLTPGGTRGHLFTSWRINTFRGSDFLSFLLIGMALHFMIYAASYSYGPLPKAGPAWYAAVPLPLVYLGALIEDLIYRGFLFAACRARMNTLWTISLVTGIAVLAHLPGVPFPAIPLLAIGLLAMTTIRECGGFWRMHGYHVGWNVGIWLLSQ